MSVMKRDIYSFHGPKAEDSVKYFDSVIAQGYNGDMLYLAWDAAHKFGSRMTSDNITSFRWGIVIGDNSLKAAEFLDSEYEAAYKSCEEFGRKEKMKSILGALCASVKTEYSVDITMM